MHRPVHLILPRKDGYLDEIKKYISAPDHILRFMDAENKAWVETMMRLADRAPMTQAELDEVTSSYAAFEKIMKRDEYVRPVHDLKKSLEEIATMAAMRPATLAAFFREDSYVGSDIRRVLLDPTGIPVNDPDRIYFTSKCFGAFIKPRLNGFTKERNFVLALTGILGGGEMPYPFQPEMSLMHKLLACNRYECLMVPVEEHLRSQGYPNLALIAARLGQHFEALSDDIIRRAAIVYTLQRGKPRPFPETYPRV